MGYRSEIGVLITCPKTVSGDKIIKKLERVWGDKKDFHTTFDVNEKADGEHRYVGLHCDWVKWYEDCFSDVRRFMEFISSWNDHYKTGGVHYVRIGESLGDIEENFYGDPEEFISVWSNMSVMGDN